MNDSTRPRFPYPYPEPIQARPVGTGLHAEWEASGLANKWQWRDTYEALFNGMGAATYLKRAERLAGYGFAPQDLEGACANPRSVVVMPDSEQCREEDAEAFAALAHEAALYYSTGYGSAREKELGYARRLISMGWLQPQVAALLGVSKQRVSKLLKQKRTTFGAFPGLRETTSREQDPQVRAALVKDKMGRSAAQVGHSGLIFRRRDGKPREDGAGDGL